MSNRRWKDVDKSSNDPQKLFAEKFLQDILRYKQSNVVSASVGMDMTVVTKDDMEASSRHSAAGYVNLDSTNIPVIPSLFPLLNNLTENISASQQKPLQKSQKQHSKHLPSCYRNHKKVTLTQYWIPKENEWDETTDGKRIFLGGDEKRAILDKKKNVLAMVPSIMYDRCNMEGSVSSLEV
ncbi:hypothetical protein G6F36_010437 [Rhizopus arrhizus]|nr:hypothetical protein G6F36_010437 [Rhizopus arrhizus]